MTKNELLAADGVKLAPAGAAGALTIASGNIATFLDANRAKIAERCAKLIDPAKLTRICVQLINDDKSGKLRQCTQDSFLAALLDCLSCGLLPTHGRGQLIPYGSEVKFQIGYQGILELAARAGITAKPYLIFEEDDFDWTAGTDEAITHKPNFRARRTPEALIGAYVVATYPDGSKRFEVMTKDEIDAIRDRSPSGKGTNGPWKTDYLEMAKKTVIRRASKYWPIKYDFDAAIEGDAETDIADAEFASVPSDLFLLYANRIDRAKNLDELDLIGKEIAEKFDVTTAERKAERDSLRELFADRKAEIEGRS